MKLADELIAEHELIDRALGAFRTWAQAWARGEGEVAHGRAFLTFFQRWAHDFHHAREEDVFVPALVAEVSLPRERGPIAVILDDHVVMGRLRAAMTDSLDRDDAGSRQRVDELAREFSHRLWHHLDAENSVFFPEGVERLRKRGVYELEGRGPTADELEAKRAVEALLERYPPLRDATVYRGDGCVMCPAYNETCRGLEREWWTESEWDELSQRLGSD
ncbi:MAG: hemerythrin domain-containing protein [Myxococcaceae bacterium]|nr:hemerythrin domain-containing protein [Myxococcaceae bacterium]